MPSAPSEHQYDDARVWAMCAYLNDWRDEGRECHRCSSWGPETYRTEACKRGCRAIAEEAINVAETGNPWRKDDVWPKP